jgi:hypothetical protein
MTGLRNIVHIVPGKAMKVLVKNCGTCLYNPNLKTKLRVCQRMNFGSIFWITLNPIIRMLPTPLTKRSIIVQMSEKAKWRIPKMKLSDCVTIGLNWKEKRFFRNIFTPFERLHYTFKGFGKRNKFLAYSA